MNAERDRVCILDPAEHYHPTTDDDPKAGIEDRDVLRRVFGEALIHSGHIDFMLPAEARALIEFTVAWWLEVIDQTNARLADTNGTDA